MDISSTSSNTTQPNTKLRKTKQKTKTEVGTIDSYFIPTARLNKGQRKLCHCIMKIRPQQPPYSICYSQAYKTMKSPPKGESVKQYKFIPKYTNCVMNYNYNNYSLDEIRAFCTEKKIQTMSPKGIPYGKSALIRELTKHYVKRHRTIKNKNNLTMK